MVVARDAATWAVEAITAMATSIVVTVTAAGVALTGTADRSMAVH